MENPYEKSFASHENAKYWSDKNSVGAHEMTIFSNKTAIFYCKECNHEYEAVISSIALKKYCSYCRGDKLCSNLDCMLCFNRSIASYEKSKYWSPLNTISPRFVLKGSGHKYIFNCNVCNHDFKMTVNKIKYKDAWCPYCTKIVCSDNNCMFCFNNSFASHPKSKFWSSKNTITPRDVRISSANKYYFNCDNCDHTFITRLSAIKKGSWCSYCSNPSKLLCTDTNCLHCFNKSFASHEMSLYWSPKNILKPRDIFKWCNKKFIFVCNENNHEFTSTLNNISTGRWCSYCKNKTESSLYKWLAYNYKDVKYQSKYDWCRNPTTNMLLSYDFEYNNIIIELDGAQHFRQVSNWRTPEEQNCLDKYKMALALKHNMHIIRILQEYVYKNIHEWDKTLSQAISSLETAQEPTILYIGVDPTYFENLPDV